MRRAGQHGKDGLQEPSGPDYVVDFLSSSEGLQLNRAFVKIADPKVRRRVIDLVRSLADAADADEFLRQELTARAPAAAFDDRP